MQTNLNPSPSLESRGILGKDAFQNVNDMIRSLATLQSGDTRPAGIKSGEFWCKNLEGNGTKFQVFRYMEVTTPEGVQKTDIPWTIELVQSISASASASTEKAPSEKAVSLALEEAILRFSQPTASILISMADSVPGYLLGTGAAVSRETYADLFAVIGTTFGAGDGSTTFNLPDFRGRFIQGANNDLGSVKEAGLPNITGGGLQFGSVRNNPYMYGALFNNSYNNVRGAGYNDACGVDFDASRSNPIYGNSDTVQPPAISLNVFIKY